MARRDRAVRRAQVRIDRRQAVGKEAALQARFLLEIRLRLEIRLGVRLEVRLRLAPREQSLQTGLRHNTSQK